MRARIAASIKHWPNRQGFQQLIPIISRVLSDPPESTILAGSNIEALLYGQPLFDGASAQAEAATSDCYSFRDIGSVASRRLGAAARRPEQPG